MMCHILFATDIEVNGLPSLTALWMTHRVLFVSVNHVMHASPSLTVLCVTHHVLYVTVNQCNSLRSYSFKDLGDASCPVCDCQSFNALPSLTALWMTHHVLFVIVNKINGIPSLTV